MSRRRIMTLDGFEHLNTVHMIEKNLVSAGGGD